MITSRRIASFSIFCAKAVIGLCLAASLGFSTLSLSGCDFVRLHFKALNDNGIYFSEESYVGLGLYRHQPLEDKNSMNWINDHTCHEYDDLSSGMFLKEGNNFHSIKELLLASRATDIAALVVLVIGCLLSWKKKKMETSSPAPAYYSTATTSPNGHKEIPITEEEENEEALALSSQSKSKCLFVVLLPLLECLLLLVLTGTGLALHLFALPKMSDEGGICDRDTYFPNGWYDKYPLQSYREYAYFKFFHECEMGQDGIKSITSKNCQMVAFVVSSMYVLVTILYTVMYYCYHSRIMAGDEESSYQHHQSSKDDDATVGSDGSNISSTRRSVGHGDTVMTRFPLEVADEMEDLETASGVKVNGVLLPSNASCSRASSVMVGVLEEN